MAEVIRLVELLDSNYIAAKKSYSTPNVSVSLKLENGETKTLNFKDQIKQAYLTRRLTTQIYNRFCEDYEQKKIIIVLSLDSKHPHYRIVRL